MGDEMIILSIRPCGTSRVLLHGVKSYDIGPSRFTSHPRGRCAADFYHLGRVLNPQPLVLVASTLTTTPPKRLLIGHGKLLMPVQTPRNETCNIVDDYFVWSMRGFFLLRRAINHMYDARMCATYCSRSWAGGPCSYADFF
jgi:hypothetical protein